MYFNTNIIELSFVGTNYKPVLHRVNYGQGIHYDSRVTYLCKAGGRYRTITTPHCMSIETRLEDKRAQLLDLSESSKASMTLHFKRRAN